MMSTDEHEQVWETNKPLEEEEHMSRRLGFLVLVLAAVALTAVPAMAQEHGADAADTGKNIWQYIGAAFCIGVAASFGALGQAKGIAAACEAMGRNPGAAGPIRITMIIGLALIESLVIYSLIIAFMILAG
jgi:F-type H+-transporting ATPase subunit c